MKMLLIMLQIVFNRNGSAGRGPICSSLVAEQYCLENESSTLNSKANFNRLMINMYYLPFIYPIMLKYLQDVKTITALISINKCA